MEEGLSFGGLGAVVGELVRLPMVSSRRLQLAAERTGTMALGVRRWRRQTEANDFGQPTASTTRWRVSVMPSEALPVPGVGRPQWFLELMRVKAGECAEFLVRACDDKGRIHLSSGSADVYNTRSIDAVLRRLRVKARDAGMELPIQVIHGSGFQLSASITTL